MEILELKNIVMKLKSPLDKLNSRMEMQRKESINLKIDQQKLPNLNNREREKVETVSNQSLEDPWNKKKKD